MSRQTIFTDDHTNTPIDPTEAPESEAAITVKRGTYVVTWPELNLSQASFAELTELLTKFCPDVTTIDNARFSVYAADASEGDEPIGQGLTRVQADELAAQHPGARIESDGQAPVRAVAPASPGGTRTSADRARTKAIREWWKGLSPGELTTLGLEACETDRGKMPVPVLEAYTRTHP
jgi:hypothetical protein